MENGLCECEEFVDPKMADKALPRIEWMAYKNKNYDTPPSFHLFFWTCLRVGRARGWRPGKNRRL